MMHLCKPLRIFLAALLMCLLLPACSELCNPKPGSGEECATNQQEEHPTTAPATEEEGAVPPTEVPEPSAETPEPEPEEPLGEGAPPEPETGTEPEEDTPEDPGTPPPVKLYTYNVVARYPHDPEAFTQGLQYVDGELFEGTGIRGQSTLRRVALETGEVLQKIDLDRKYFGEGITVMGGHIYQLTWQYKTGFVYEKDTFNLVREFSYPTEGWGITHDGARLIMSDGTAKLYFLDPNSLTRTGEVTVHSASGPVNRINELEYIKGEVYANVWQTNSIVIIDPTTGRITGVIDLAGILPAECRTGYEDVLNGIAYDEAGDRLFVTGKRWPLLFEIDLVEVK